MKKSDKSEPERSRTASKYKVVITGGHHNSALALAKELTERGMAEVVWYGHRHTMLGDKSDSAEYKEVSSSGFVFREIKAGKVYRTFNPLHWLRLPFGFFQALWYLLKDRPDLVISFGGYLAAPVVLTAWLLGIPTVTHEQTTVVGLANKFIALFADKIFITWPQSKKYFEGADVVITGLPLREDIFKYDENHRFFSEKLPVLYITGGKQGSHIINETVAAALPKLLKHFNIIHQCGEHSHFNDKEMLENVVSSLDEKLQARYMVKTYVFSDEIGQVFHEADIVLSRAGAHTIYELAALGKPALFVPIPWVSHNEQYKNARILVNEGAAGILPENRLSPETLRQELFHILENLDSYKDGARRASQAIIFNATERIIDEVEKILEAKGKTAGRAGKEPANA